MRKNQVKQSKVKDKKCKNREKEKKVKKEHRLRVEIKSNSKRFFSKIYSINESNSSLQKFAK